MTAPGSPTTRRGRLWAGGLAIAFGAATLFEGGHVLFGGPETRAEAGDIVLFVLVFNFSAGFAYLAAGLGAVLGRRWAVWLAWTLAASTALVFVAFGVHVARGGAFELRTVAAMSVRTGFWIAQSFVLSRCLPQPGHDGS